MILHAPVISDGPYMLSRQVPLRLICTYAGPSTEWLYGYDRWEMERNRTAPPACNLVRDADLMAMVSAPNYTLSIGRFEEIFGVNELH